MGVNSNDFTAGFEFAAPIVNVGIVYELIRLILPFYAEAAPKKELKLAPLKHKSGAYELLEAKALAIETEQHLNGWGYIVSGAVVMGISIPGYYFSSDAFAQVIYSVGETLSVGAITYGANLVLIDNEYRSFDRILKSDPHLGIDDKEVLAQSFMLETAKKAKQGRKIRFVFHSPRFIISFLSLRRKKSPKVLRQRKILM